MDSLEKGLQRLESELRRVVGLPGIAGGAPMSAEFMLSRIVDIVSGWSPSSVGGDEGSVQLQKVEVTLNNEQIKSLPTVFPEIIAPTEITDYAGITILPFPLAAIVGPFIRHGAEYGNITTDPEPAFRIIWGSDFSLSAAIPSKLGSEEEVTETLGGMFISSPESNSTVPFSFVCGILDPSFFRPNDFFDNGLYLTLNNGGLGNLTGGDPDDTLKVTVWYDWFTF